MKRLAILTLTALTIALCVPNADAQWTQIGPQGGSVTGFAVSGNTVYAATNGGVLISTDNGNDWTHSNLGFLNGEVMCVAATSSKVFAGTWGDTLYSRDLNGLIWQKTSLGDNYVQCLAVIGNDVFAGSYGGGVYLSTDEGATWTQMNNGLTEHQVECFSVSGTNLFAGTASGVYLTTDKGSSWSKVSIGLGYNNTETISLAINGGNLYAGVWGSAGWTSPNNGGGWLQLGGSFPGSPYIYSWAFSGSNIYVASAWVYVTSDGGVTWTELSGDNCPYQVYALAMIGPNLVAGTRDSGIYVSSNGGAKWTHAERDLPNYCMNGVAAAGGNLLEAGTGGLFRSTDDGANWDYVQVGDYEWADLSTVSFRNNTYALAGDVNGIAYVSSDGGYSWESGVQVEKGASISAFAYISTYIFASTQPYAAEVAGGVYLSKDNGATWTRVSSGLPTMADTNTNVNSLAVIGSNLFAGTGHGVYMSSDNGTSWTKVSNGLSGSLVYSLASRGTELFAGLFGQGVFRSNDNGESWTHTTLVKDVTSLMVADTNVFVGTWGEGTYVLANSDSSWRPTGLTGRYVSAFAAVNGRLLAATENSGVYERPIPELITGAKSKTSGVPTVFALQQNYPNPFNPTTAIGYSLLTKSFVTLKVFDVLGREVKTLVNERQNAGTYTVTFNGSGLSSGVYLYRITAGLYSETKKLVLMK